MRIEFAGGQIFETDYFDNIDRMEGRAWLALDRSCWHVLLPRPCHAEPAEMVAMPVRNDDEPDGWMWALWLDEWKLRLPVRQIHGERPPLPEPGTRSRRAILLYANEIHRASGQSFFGSLETGIQVNHRGLLWVVRGMVTRRGRR